MKKILMSIIPILTIIIAGFAFSIPTAEPGIHITCGGSFEITVNGSCPPYTMKVYKGGLYSGRSCVGSCTYCCISVDQAGYYDIYADNGQCAGWARNVHWDGYSDTQVSNNVNCYGPIHH